MVPKKADPSGKQKWRIVVDYGKLNNITVDDRYPIPNMDGKLGKLGRSNITTIHLTKGFHQIETRPESIEKTAFNVYVCHLI